MERFEVVVVGSGPAGATAARFAARGGARTLLVDQRPELGYPVQCGEFVPTPTELADLFPCPDIIAEAFVVPPETVLQPVEKMVCVSPRGDRFRFPLAGYVVSRRAYDKRLALDAEGEGAELRFPRGVTRVRDGTVEFAGGEHYVYGDGVGGAECLRHGDEQPVLVELHHQRGGPVPVQHLAGRDADRGDRGG